MRVASWSRECLRSRWGWGGHSWEKCGGFSVGFDDEGWRGEGRWWRATRVYTSLALLLLDVVRPFVLVLGGQQLGKRGPYRADVEMVLPAEPGLRITPKLSKKTQNVKVW